MNKINARKNLDEYNHLKKKLEYPGKYHIYFKIISIYIVFIFELKEKWNFEWYAIIHVTNIWQYK